MPAAPRLEDACSFDSGIKLSRCFDWEMDQSMFESSVPHSTAGREAGEVTDHTDGAAMWPAAEGAVRSSRERGGRGYRSYRWGGDVAGGRRRRQKQYGGRRERIPIIPMTRRCGRRLK